MLVEENARLQAELRAAQERLAAVERTPMSDGELLSPAWVQSRWSAGSRARRREQVLLKFLECFRRF